jgi:hypothetical protein
VIPVAQARSHHYQSLRIPTKVERITLSHSLEEHLHCLDSLIEQCIDRPQWVICQTDARKTTDCSLLSLSRKSLFPQLCQEVQQRYGALTHWGR